MAANALQASYTDLQTEVALSLGWNTTVASWTSANTTHWGVINREALRQVYYPDPLDGERTGHVWSWLRPRGSLTLNAPYATGTVAIAAGVVTLTSGTWPSWAASGDLWVDGERYPVDTRDSNSQITLEDTSVAVSSGATYELIQHEYDLPSDFGGMASNAFTVRRDQQEWGRIPLVSPGDLMACDRSILGTGLPTKAAIVPVPPTATTDARWQAQFADPFPRDDLRLEFRYIAVPPLLDGTTHVYHYGGPSLSHCVTCSYLDIAFQKIRDSFERREAFRQALRQAVMYDRANFTFHTFGDAARSIGTAPADPMDVITRRRAQTSGVTFESIGAV